MGSRSGTAEVRGKHPASGDARRLDRGDAGSAGKARWPRYVQIAAAALFVAGLTAGVVGITALIYPAIPRVLVMAAGAEGGAYSNFGERYREFFAQEGVQLTVLHTRGSAENLAMLRYHDFSASIALVQSGLTNPRQSPDLVSLGTVAFEPVWIFCRSPLLPSNRLHQLRGMRVSIGPTGSGTRSLALKLLAQNGIDDSNTELLPFTMADTAARLLTGDIDAGVIVASSDAPSVKELLASPDINLLSLTHADAYVALFPFLSKIILPAGFADLANTRPPADVEMLAVKTSLVVRRDLQPAIQYLLLDAATRIHSHSGVFQKPGEFPASEATDLPLSDDARQFYRSGLPLLQRYLPLWLAILVRQLALALLPLAAIGYPVLRTVPAVYGWGMRRRIYRLYGELKLLENMLDGQDQEQRSAALSDLSRLEHRARHLRVPSHFAHLLYMLQQDIRVVRARLDAAELK